MKQENKTPNRTTETSNLSNCFTAILETASTIIFLVFAIFIFIFNICTTKGDSM